MPKRSEITIVGFSTGSALVMKEAKFSRFAKIHLLCYYTSVANLCAYALHFGLYGQEGEWRRSFIGAGVEALLMSIRFLNELTSGKVTFGDYLHHVAHFGGIALVMYRADCQQYMYLLTQMNIIHIPMLCWYSGARRNGGSFSSVHLSPPASTIMCDVASISFPVLFVISSAFRAGSMAIACIHAYTHGQTVALTGLAVIAAVLVYLDSQWQAYFFREIQFPSVWCTLSGLPEALVRVVPLMAALLGLLMGALCSY